MFLCCLDRIVTRRTEEARELARLVMNEFDELDDKSLMLWLVGRWSLCCPNHLLKLPGVPLVESRPQQVDEYGVILPPLGIPS